MKNYFKIFTVMWIGILLSLGLHATKHSKRWTIDKIVARVNGVNIFQSDLNQLRIAKEGARFSLDEAIIEELLFQRAAEMHMLPTVLDVERQLVSFKVQNDLTNLSDSEFEAQLKEGGFTLKTYKNQLSRLIAVENVKRAEISEKIVITTQEVEAYYNQNPKYTKEEYLLAVCSLTKDQLPEKDALITSAQISWENLGWIARKDVNKNLESVFSMQKGQISEAIKIGGEYQIVKLIDKKESQLKTLDERYVDIERYLQQQRKKSFMGDFEKEIKQKASIVYLS